MKTEKSSVKSTPTNSFDWVFCGNKEQKPKLVKHRKNGNG